MGTSNQGGIWSGSPVPLSTLNSFLAWKYPGCQVDSLEVVSLSSKTGDWRGRALYVHPDGMLRSESDQAVVGYESVEIEAESFAETRRRPKLTRWRKNASFGLEQMLTW